MPSLVEIVDVDLAQNEKAAPDVLAAFEKAKREPKREVPDLMAAFERATAVFRKDRREQREGDGPERSRPLTPPPHREGHEPDRER